MKIFCFKQERLSHLKSQCQPHITEAAKSSVEVKYFLVAKYFVSTEIFSGDLQEDVQPVLRLRQQGGREEHPDLEGGEHRGEL